MSSIAFNNLKFSEKLTSAGMPHQQASVLAESIHEITTSINNTLTVIEDTFATKKDLENMAEKFVTKEELKIELTTLKFDLKTEIRTEVHKIELNVKVLNWMMGLLLTGNASLIALITKMFFILNQVQSHL